MGRRLNTITATAAGLLIAAFAVTGCEPVDDGTESGIATAGANGTVVESGLSQLLPPADLDGPYRVTRVIDGDTFAATGPRGEVTVRMLGIDTPETKHPDKKVGCFGPEASANAARLLEDATVQLQYDANAGRTDTYGRTLAYAWVDGQMVNHLQLLQGYAYEYTYDKSSPYGYRKEFRAAEKTARRAGAGLWNEATCDGKP